MKTTKARQKKKPKQKLHTIEVGICIPDVKHIVVHSTCTPQEMTMDELEQLPYHFLVLKNGKIIGLSNFDGRSPSIEIAYLGGLNHNGKYCDNRTREQKEAMFLLLVELVEIYPNAKVVAADEIYVYSHANPGFDIKNWLHSYIPDFLQA